MRSRCLGTALLCGCLWAFPTLAADKNAAPDAGKDVDGDKLPPGQFTGKLKTVPGSDGSFTINVEIDSLQLKPGAGANEAAQVLRDQQQLERLQADVARARNAKEYQQRVQRLATEMQRMQAQLLVEQLKANSNYTIKRDYKDIDFHTSDAVKVRMMNPPTKFDDKGNPKEYTKAELKELKGKDADLPGYETTLDSLKTGDTVQVTLGHSKPAKKDDAADKDKADDKKPDAEMKKGNEVTIILIVAEEGGDMKKKK